MYFQPVQVSYEAVNSVGSAVTQKFYAGQESILYVLAKPELWFQV